MLPALNANLMIQYNLYMHWFIQFKIYPRIKILFCKSLFEIFKPAATAEFIFNSTQLFYLPGEEGFV